MPDADQPSIILPNTDATSAAPSCPASAVPDEDVRIRVRDLTVAFGSFVLMRNVSFDVRVGDIFMVMGGSGCGKSTLLRVLMGLKEPQQGQICYNGEDFWAGTEESRSRIMRNTGVLFQGGALWSSMTLAENVGLPLQQYTDLTDDEIREQASLKLALAGLAGFEDYYPSEISGGMRKRAGLARALALDPQILFLDEPSAGLDPVSSRLLDDLILELRDSLGTTFVIVSHELPSIFTIARNSIFLDAQSRTVTASGNPSELVKDPNTEQSAKLFLTRGGMRDRNEDAGESATAATSHAATSHKEQSR